MGIVLERGDIFFLYRPKVGLEHVRGLGDVQRLVVILKPEGMSRFRHVVIGRKRLPEPDEHERMWGFVDLVADSVAELAELADELDPQQYETRTRGPQPGAGATRGGGRLRHCPASGPHAPRLRHRAARAAGTGAA